MIASGASQVLRMILRRFGQHAAVPLEVPQCLVRPAALLSTADHGQEEGGKEVRPWRKSVRQFHTCCRYAPLPGPGLRGVRDWARTDGKS